MVLVCFCQIVPKTKEEYINLRKKNIQIARFKFSNLHKLYRGTGSWLNSIGTFKL